MAVPKNRHTKSRRNNRRSHLRLSPVTSVLCEKCGIRIPPHHLCEECGSYKGREMVDVLKKQIKKSSRQNVSPYST